MQINRIEPIESTYKQSTLKLGNATDAIVGKCTVVFGISDNRFAVYIELE